MVPSRPDQRELFRERLVLAALLLTMVILLGSAGYHVLGGGRWPIEDIFYFTVITLSTVGFAETLPGMAEVPYARLWTTGMIFFGSGTLLYFISTLTAFIVEGDLQGAIRRNRMQKRIDHLNGHYIICGVGATGIHVVEELLNTNHSFVVVDWDSERLQQLSQRFGPQRFHFVEGDATDDDVLTQAGISKARGVVAALTDDKDNLYITLTAYQLERKRADAGDLRIVSKAIEKGASAKLIAAGAHRVVSPSQIGGLRMASEMIRPAVVEFLDLMLRDPEKNLRIEEVEIPEGSPLAGARLKDAGIRSVTQAMVIAIRGPNQQYQYNPGPETVLEAGFVLIVLAETPDMNRLREGILSGEIGRR